MQGVARSKITFSLYHWAIWGKEGHAEQTEIGVWQVGTTDKKCSLKAPIPWERKALLLRQAAN